MARTRDMRPGAARICLTASVQLVGVFPDASAAEIRIGVEGRSGNQGVARPLDSASEEAAGEFPRSTLESTVGGLTKNGAGRGVRARREAAHRSLRESVPGCQSARMAQASEKAGHAKRRMSGRKLRYKSRSKASGLGWGARRLKA